ncbi:MAG: type I 3-dehydroquinate dehydratase [Bryobacteraceae bacterium]|nr:type I 3-dehydroquinate dehydratase [Bryobacteraceae bacterium]
MRISRRDLMLAAMGAGAAAGADRYRPELAGQVYIWTQYLQKENKTLKDGLEEIVGGTRAAGYDHVELMYTFFTPELRDQTIALVRKHKLKVPIVYNGGPMHEPAAAEKTIAQTLELADVLKPLGTGILNVNPNPKPERARKTDAELKTQAEAVNRLGQELQKKNVRLILHHHDPEMADNAREWHHLLENTQAGLCIDTMWVARGGQNPMAIVRKAGPRLASLHLRNMRSGVCTEAFGDGDIDYRELAAYLKGMRYDGWLVVELFHEPGTQVTRTVKENLKLSGEYARRIFAV